MRAVKCETQEQWDFVNDKLARERNDLPSSYWEEEGRDREGRRVLYKNLDSATYGSSLCYNLVYTFDGWCRMEGWERDESLKDSVEDLSYLEVLFKKLNIN